MQNDTLVYSELAIVTQELFHAAYDVTRTCTQSIEL